MHIDYHGLLPKSDRCEHRHVDWSLFEPHDPAKPLRVTVTCMIPKCWTTRTVELDRDTGEVVGNV